MYPNQRLLWLQKCHTSRAKLAGEKPLAVSE